jgi:hypothetical protein
MNLSDRPVWITGDLVFLGEIHWKFRFEECNAGKRRFYSRTVSILGRLQVSFLVRTTVAITSMKKWVGPNRHLTFSTMIVISSNWGRFWANAVTS